MALIEEPGSPGPVAAARVYLGLQAASGALWWIGVYASDGVRDATLGSWNRDVLAVPDLVFFSAGSLAAALTGRWWLAAVVTCWSAAVTVALAVSAIQTREAGWGVVAMTLATTCTLVTTSLLRNGTIPARWFFVGPFRFRPARQHTGRVHVLHSLIQLVIFWTLLLGALPMLAARLERHLRIDATWLDGQALGGTGWLLFAISSCLGLWACLTMASRGQGTPLPAATARHLVTDGPYGYVRNPMAVAGAGQTIGVGLGLGSWVVLAAAVSGAAIWHTIIRPVEEADLSARLGADYDAYRSHVRCWLPGRPRSRAPGRADHPVG